MKNALNKYMTSVIWYLLNFGDQTIPRETFITMAKRIEESEDDLRVQGASSEAIRRLLNYCKKMTITPVDKLSTNGQLRLGKLIFGGGTKWKN